MKNDFLKKNRELIAVAIFFLTCGLLVYFVVIPLLGKIIVIKDEIEGEAIKQDIKKQRLNELPKLNQQYQEINNQEGKIDVFLDKGQAVTLIERLEKLAQETKNEITIAVQEDVPQKNVPQKGKADSSATMLVDSLPSKDYLKLKISLVGDYNGINEFINNLETSEYYSDITMLSISHSRDNADGVSSSGMSTVKNGDSSNPFGGQQSGGVPAVVVQKNNNELSASLEVVFYIKKK